jgi:type II secretory pathway component PulK
MRIEIMPVLSSQLSAVSNKRLHTERGVALILTLAIIALVTLMVIAFAVSMRVENTASKNSNDLAKTRELAKGAIDQAVARIRQTTTRGATIANYVTFPGVVYDFDTSVNQQRGQFHPIRLT